MAAPARLPPAAADAGTLLALAAATAAAAWFNFGLFHGPGFVHRWEQFHYFLGSKYFPELGYDGLYVASIAAQLESDPACRCSRSSVTCAPTRWYPPTRCQSTRRRCGAASRRPAGGCSSPTTGTSSGRATWITSRQIRTDHGYNPTPTWTFVARLADRFVPATDTSLGLLGLLDPALLLVMFVVVFRTYGSRIGCLALLVFGLGYPWRYDWVGGAFLRQDWLAAVVIGVCMLRRERYALAGALFGYATMVRVFPALLLAGLAIAAAGCAARREPVRWALRFATGLVVAILLAVGAGCLTGRGAAAWPEFVHNLAKYQGTWLTNNVGSRNLVLYGPDTVSRRLVDWTLAEPWSRWQQHMDRLQRERAWAVVLVALAFMALLAAAAWRAPPDEAAVLGLVAVYALVELTCYYWMMLLAMPIRRGALAAVGLLALGTGLFALDLATPAFEMIYGAMSWGLAVLFVAWTAPDVVATVRGWRTAAERRARPA